MTLPFFPVKLNPLDALLATLGVRLIRLAKNPPPDFAKAIKDKQLVLQFVSDDGVARFFEFNHSTIAQTLGTHPSPNLTILFKDSTKGAKLLARADTASLMKAIQDGEVVVTGDYKLVLWFAGIVKIAVKIPDEYKPYLAKAKPYFSKAKGMIERALDKIKHS